MKSHIKAYITTALLLLFASLCIYGQQWKDFMDEGKRLYKLERYHEAIKYFENAKQKNSRMAGDANKWIQECKKKLIPSDDPYIPITLAQDNVRFPSQGATDWIGVSGGKNWKPKSSSKWCTVSKDKGGITITCTANTDTTERHAIVTIKDGKTEKTIRVSQLAPLRAVERKIADLKTLETNFTLPDSFQIDHLKEFAHLLNAPRSIVNNSLKKYPSNRSKEFDSYFIPLNDTIQWSLNDTTKQELAVTVFYTKKYTSERIAISIPFLVNIIKRNSINRDFSTSFSKYSFPDRAPQFAWINADSIEAATIGICLSGELLETISFIYLGSHNVYEKKLMLSEHLNSRSALGFQNEEDSYSSTYTTTIHHWFEIGSLLDNTSSQITNKLQSLHQLGGRGKVDYNDFYSSYREKHEDDYLGAFDQTNHIYYFARFSNDTHLCYQIDAYLYDKYINRQDIINKLDNAYHIVDDDNSIRIWADASKLSVAKIGVVLGSEKVSFIKLSGDPSTKKRLLDAYKASATSHTEITPPQSIQAVPMIEWYMVDCILGKNQDRISHKFGIGKTETISNTISYKIHSRKLNQILINFNEKSKTADYIFMSLYSQSEQDYLESFICDLFNAKYHLRYSNLADEHSDIHVWIDDAQLESATCAIVYLVADRIIRAFPLDGSVKNKERKIKEEMDWKKYRLKWE